jgi:hypothetical protein
VRGEDPDLAVMQDGRVLIAGGTTKPDSAAAALDAAEIYDRAHPHATGPAGVDDIRIVLGAQAATRHKAFTYKIAGLEKEWIDDA